MASTPKQDNDDELALDIDLYGPDDSLGGANRATQCHKLDVLMSKEVNRIVICNIVIWISCLMYVLLAIVLSNTIFFEHKTVSLKSNPPREIRAASDSRAFFGFELSITLLASCGLFLLAIVFPLRVFVNNKFPITHAQVWVALMVMAHGLTLNPLLQILLLHDEVFSVEDPYKNNVVFRRFVMGMRTFRSFGSTVGIALFLMASAAWYGQLEPMRTNRDYFFFYVPKVVPLVAYQIVREMARFDARIVLSVVPFSNLAGFIANSVTLGVWFRKQLMYVAIITTFEVCFLLYMLIQIKATGKVLRKCDYLKYRSKQIGFRFFLWVNVIYYSLFVVFDLLVTIFVPRYNNLKPLFGSRHLHEHIYTNSQWGGFVFEYLDVFYQFLTAYVFLPPDSYGFSGWFKPSNPYLCERTENSVVSEPLSLTTRERSTVFPNHWSECDSSSLVASKYRKSSLDTRSHSSALCLPTHIGLFNFTWLVYDWGRRGFLQESKFDWLQSLNPRVEEHIRDSATDTNLIIVACSDRVIIAFKGTTSIANLKTDMNMVRVSLGSRLPTRKGATSEILETREFESRARVHKGFMDVYASVADRVVDCVARLLESNRRPVLLTGHSLGGALATICSLDLRVSLGLGKTDVVVSTYGSPRVGNIAWAELYDEHIRTHWRFTVERDIVPCLPKIGYRHVGKRVLLMPDGNIFLDPNTLEAVMWMSTDVPSALHHRKVYYLFCLTRCVRKFTEQEPSFWGAQLSNEEAISSDLDRLRTIGTAALDNLALRTS